MADSHFVAIAGHRLHLRRFGPEQGVPALLLHGAISNGRVFYSDSGKGLAPYLAAQGFCTYVADLRGRGQSQPAIAERADHGQREAICDDLPALQQFIRARHPTQPVHWLAHSWGGVLMAATLVRYPQLAAQVASLTFFGSKRQIRSWSLERLVKVELVWRRLAPYWARRHGYLPARQKGIGADDETPGSLADSIHWVSSDSWRDAHDHFDYQQQVAKVAWPRLWMLAGQGDKALGNPADVARFQQEMGAPGHLTILGKKQGYGCNYNHLNMLVGPQAAAEVFPQVNAWLASAALPTPAS